MRENTELRERGGGGERGMAGGERGGGREKEITFIQTFRSFVRERGGGGREIQTDRDTEAETQRQRQRQ